VGTEIVRRIACLAAVVVVVAASGASASPIYVGFESDTAGFNPPNGFTSNDSSQIHFSDTSGSDLFIVEEPIGNNALAVLFKDDSGLLMEFDFVASALSLDFGNTFGAIDGDNAVLTVFLGGDEVGSTFLELNLTDAIDQTISYSGVWFDSAIFRYEVAAGKIELVDNLNVTPAIPEPHAGLVFGMGALLVGAVCGRRSSAEAGHS